MSVEHVYVDPDYQTTSKQDMRVNKSVNKTFETENSGNLAKQFIELAILARSSNF